MAGSFPMQGVIPCLAINGRAGAACDFHARGFGAEDWGLLEDPFGIRWAILPADAPDMEGRG